MSLNDDDDDDENRFVTACCVRCSVTHAIQTVGRAQFSRLVYRTACDLVISLTEPASPRIRSFKSQTTSSRLTSTVLYARPTSQQTITKRRLVLPSFAESG